jgi:histidine kinase/DNA gyrase B/HSP90-like ATPase
MTPTIGSHALLLQLSTNLVLNAIVHNLPEQGTVWVTTSVHPKSVVLTVENTGEKLTPQFVATLVEPFRRGTERIRTEHAGVGLGLAIVKSITQAHDGTLTLTPRAAGGSALRCNYPPAPPHTCMTIRCPAPVITGSVSRLAVVRGRSESGPTRDRFDWSAATSPGHRASADNRGIRASTNLRFAQ